MNEESLFTAALEKAAGYDRREFLDAACGGDDALRQRVERLLAADERDRGILDRPLDPLAAGPCQPGPPLTADEHFADRFKLRQKLGEGGMGEVWVADQTDPVQRRVAVKVIRPGLDSARLLARFDQERQALALMDHPNIARVLDAGVADGRPYFVMELIKGVPITEYCDAARLSTRERLELFVPVCHAVQHAHQKGIIHRDLKPSNILIGLYDGKPVPKVIDFGVAKATGPRLTEQSIYTEVGSLIGTLEYMSPEQAELNNLDVDTRSDIYTLGAVLYELLTGSVPLTRRELQASAFTEALRMIKEVEPQKPSTRLSGSGTLPSVAAVRHTEPKKLLALLRGELDWVVMKCLEKDRSRRYETAGALATDVHRYLADEPVEASPPSTVYRVKKFVRRNRGAVFAGSIIFLLLVAGIVGTSIGLIRAERRAEGERQAKDTAEKRLGQIEKGIDLLGSLFADLDPFAEQKEGRPLRAILGDRLDQTAAALEGEAIGDPLVVARLQERLGQTYLGLGQAAKAEALFTKAVATRQAELGEDHLLTLGSRHNQALALEAAGKRIEALKRFEQVRDARVKVLGPDHPDTLSTLNELAAAYTRVGKATEAVRLLEQVRDGRAKHLGENHDHTLATLQDLSEAYRSANKHAEAIALLEKVRDALVRKHGDVHPRAIDALGRLAYAYQAGYKMPAALDLYKQGQEITLLKLGPHHPLTLKIQRGLAHMYRVYRKTPEAIPLLESVRERQVMILGGHHPATLNTLEDLAMAYQDAGELGKALPLFQQAAAGVEKLEYAHNEVDRYVSNLARCHEQLKQYDRAEAWRRKLVPVLKEQYGPESFRYASFFGLAGLGSNLVQQKKYDDAEPFVRESLGVLQKHFPGWDACRAESLLGAVLLGRQRYADAEPHLLNGYQGLKQLVTSQGRPPHGSLDGQNLAEALERLVQLCDATNKPDDAAKWRKELEALKAAAKPPTKP